jgi:hypothetical protein
LPKVKASCPTTNQTYRAEPVVFPERQLGRRRPDGKARRPTPPLGKLFWICKPETKIAVLTAS